MRFLSVAAMAITVLAMQTLASPVSVEGALFARDTQPTCEKGRRAACGDVGFSSPYKSISACQEDCYGVGLNIPDRSH